jgi:hypothetical protein
MVSERTLTVYCRAGLSNRVRVLISGLALAEATSRRFRMLWARTHSCGAPFRELFASDWPVFDVDAVDPTLAAYRGDAWSHRAASDLLAGGEPEVAVGLNSWLVPPDPRRRPVQYARYRELLEELTPQATLRERIEEFRARHFHPPVIGVHLRRGDFLRMRPEVADNTQAALAAVDRFLASAPHARILLCTDDGIRDQKQVRLEGLRELFRGRYGDRVIPAATRTLDRRSVDGVQDAVVDLWLLRATHMFIGTRSSSFSSLAVFGRDVPHVMVGRGARVEYLDRLGRVPGVRWLVWRLRRRGGSR